eukprot:TRINITY_DN12387_c0_g1_i1.p1 TRINITY_DN12387_c0_g1~~TRINITY_DN12387_c0_g1_i1.p1  ORF type:complete len:442 (+),score=129.85 TRINITY_DN12387_c0_g1_i1:48-1373(+)
MQTNDLFPSPSPSPLSPTNYLDQLTSPPPPPPPSLFSIPSSFFSSLSSASVSSVSSSPSSFPLPQQNDPLGVGSQQGNSLRGTLLSMVDVNRPNETFELYNSIRSRYKRNSNEKRPKVSSALANNSTHSQAQFKGLFTSAKPSPTPPAFSPLSSSLFSHFSSSKNASSSSSSNSRLFGHRPQSRSGINSSSPLSPKGSLNNRPTSTNADSSSSQNNSSSKVGTSHIDTRNEGTEKRGLVSLFSDPSITLESEVKERSFSLDNTGRDRSESLDCVLLHLDNDQDDQNEVPYLSLDYPYSLPMSSSSSSSSDSESSSSSYSSSSESESEKSQLSDHDNGTALPNAQVEGDTENIGDNSAIIGLSSTIIDLHRCQDDPGPSSPRMIPMTKISHQVETEVEEIRIKIQPVSEDEEDDEYDDEGNEEDNNYEGNLIGDDEEDDDDW